MKIASKDNFLCHLLQRFLFGINYSLIYGIKQIANYSHSTPLFSHHSFCDPLLLTSLLTSHPFGGQLSTVDEHNRPSNKSIVLCFESQKSMQKSVNYSIDCKDSLNY